MRRRRSSSRWEPMPTCAASSARATDHRGPERAVRRSRLQRRPPAFPGRGDRRPRRRRLASPRSSAASATTPPRIRTGRGSRAAAGSTAPSPAACPHRGQLDDAVPDRPAFMTGYDGHTAWANSKALAAAGITRDTPDPDARRHRRATRRASPPGALKESAPRLVGRLVPRADGRGAVRARCKRRLDEAASYGLTSVQNASFQAADLPVYERVARRRRAEGPLLLRAARW